MIYASVDRALLIAVRPRVLPVPRRSYSPVLVLRTLLLAGVAAVALSGCATNRASTASEGPDFSGRTEVEKQAALGDLAERYKRNPRDRGTIIAYAAVLRAAGQAEQAVAVMETGMAADGRDPATRIAFAKALAAAGRFPQALNVIDATIDPASPDWNALSVKGAILDQSGRNTEARVLYRQALTIAPHEPSLHANLGLSFAMTNELDEAERLLHIAVRLPGATSRIRQNLALVIALQGRFDEARTMFAAELPAEQVESNMEYVRALLTQQNRWDAIKGAS